jgi:hypothetical protein
VTRGQMRTITRRLIQDVSGSEFTNVELNILQNEGLREIANIVLSIDPEAFVKWATADIEVGQRYYPRPPDLKWELEVARRSDANSEYVPLTQAQGFQWLRRQNTQTSRGGDVTGALQDVAGTYAMVGRFYYLGYNPSVAVPAGLQIAYVYTMTMADDNDVPALHIDLHYAASVQAAVLATNEAILGEQLGLLARYYNRSLVNAPVMMPDLRMR